MKLRDYFRVFWHSRRVPAEQVASQTVVRELQDAHADLERRLRLLEAEAGVFNVDDHHKEHS